MAARSYYARLRSEVPVPDPLNPYAEWLGLAASITRPNHYELLGLRPFEAEPQTIEVAATAQRAKLRGAEPGYRPELWRRLADEIENARQCLIDPAQRQRYEAALRQGYGATGPSTKSGSSDEPSASAGRNIMPPGKNLLPPKRSGESPAPPTTSANVDQPPAGRNVMPPGRNVMPPSSPPATAPQPSVPQQTTPQQAVPAVPGGPTAAWSPPVPQSPAGGPVYVSPPAPTQATMPVAPQPLGWPGTPQQPAIPGAFPPRPQSGFPPAPLPAAALPAAPGYPGGMRISGARRDFHRRGSSRARQVIRKCRRQPCRAIQLSRVTLRPAILQRRVTRSRKAMCRRRDTRRPRAIRSPAIQRRDFPAVRRRPATEHRKLRSHRFRSRRLQRRAREGFSTA